MASGWTMEYRGRQMSMGWTWMIRGRQVADKGEQGKAGGHWLERK